jgi:hypothetical protein
LYVLNFELPHGPTLLPLNVVYHGKGESCSDTVSCRSPNRADVLAAATRITDSASAAREL